MNSSSRQEVVLIRRLLGYLRPYRRSAIAAVVLLLLHSLLGVIGPLLTKIAVDHSLRPTPLEPSWIDAWIPADRADALALLVAAYAIVLALNYVLRASQIHIMNRTGQDVMFDLRNEAFERLQSKRVAYFDRNPVGRLVTRVTSDVDALNELFTSGIAAIAGDIVTLAFIFAAMLYLSVKLTLVLLTMGPVIFFVTWFFRSRVRAHLRNVRGAVSNINAYLQERLSGIATIQLFGDEPRSLAEFEDVKQTHLSAELGAARAHSMFFPAVEMAGAVAIVLLFAGGGWLSAEGSLSLGVLVAFMQFGSRVFRPVQDLSEKFNVLQSALASSERIFSLLDEPVDETPTALAPAEPLSNPDVEFEHVWFAYGPTRGVPEDEIDWILRDVSFRVSPGEKVAFVGATGAGKTTIMKLLTRLYDVDRGVVRVDGIDVREIPQQDLRRRIATVLQDVFLFSGTIARNIALGRVDLEETDIRRAAEAVEAHPFIARLPHGYETEVIERGANFSTGQRQILSFARALAHGAHILVLDEATSAIDTETETAIQRGIHVLMEGKTAIAIAHRLSTIRDVDTIHVLKDGRLVESGSHAELVGKDGHYARLYRLQSANQGRPPVVGEPEASAPRTA